VPPFGWALSVTMASRSSGVASALLISALSLVTIAGRVPAIAKPPVALRPRRLSCLGTDQGKANPPATTSPKNHRAVAAAKPIKTANTVRMSDMGASKLADNRPSLIAVKDRSSSTRFERPPASLLGLKP
jgi:hypothetical protein